MRSIFFAMGLFVLLWGAIFLLTQQMELRFYPGLITDSGWWTNWNDSRAVFHPPEWAAFGLCALGILTMVYAVGLPVKETRNRELELLILLDESRLPREF